MSLNKQTGYQTTLKGITNKLSVAGDDEALMSLMHLHIQAGIYSSHTNKNLGRGKYRAYTPSKQLLIINIR